MLLFIGSGRARRGDILCCGACGAPISWAEAICRVMGRPPRRTYENPHGVLCPIVTLSDATGLGYQDHASTEHTWFSGYAWRPAACAACGLFLGWRFEAAGGQLPPEFFGLLEERLVSRPAGE